MYLGHSTLARLTGKASKPQTSIPTSPVLGLQPVLPPLAFPMGSGNLNSGPPFTDGAISVPFSSSMFDELWGD